jgi:hypothetical protein
LAHLRPNLTSNHNALGIDVIGSQIVEGVMATA